MRQIATSALARLIEYPEGVANEVRPPTVQDAVEVFVSVKGAIAGQEVPLGIFRAALSRWLPPSLARPLTQVPAVLAAKEVLPWCLEGTPRDPARDLDETKRPEEAKDPIDRMIALDVDGMLAEYCGVYGGEPYEVYRTVPWPFFVGMVNKIARVRAREKLEVLDTYRIRYLEHDMDRRDALRQLKEEAGIHVKELTREEKIERSKRNLEFLSRILQGKRNN